MTPWGWDISRNHGVGGLGIEKGRKGRGVDFIKTSLLGRGRGITTEGSFWRKNRY
jgi:hypothetical protein